MTLCPCTCLFLADNPNTEWLQKSEGHKGVKASQGQGCVKATLCAYRLMVLIPLNAGD